MKKSLNNKGFTLIELLAVIVILAVLILLALPNVLNIMEKSRINSFTVETQDILKYSETAYTDATVSGGILTSGGTNKAIKQMTIDGTVYRYLCIELSELKLNGYMDKDFAKQGYTGIIEIFIPTTGNAIYGINISNGSYAFQKQTVDKLAAGAQPEALTSVVNACPAADGKSYVNKPSEYVKQ